MTALIETCLKDISDSLGGGRHGTEEVFKPAILALNLAMTVVKSNKFKLKARFEAKFGKITF